MLLLAQLITNMPATMAAAIKADKPQSHLANAQLDNRNFQRIKTFTNKHADWREWKNQFVYAVAECDNPFAAIPAWRNEAKPSIQRLISP